MNWLCVLATNQDFDVAATSQRIWFSLEPVTLWHWAEFIRSEAYFEFHDRGKRSSLLGDALLERVGFKWAWRGRPVQNVTFNEALAFAHHQNARLPYFDEWMDIKQRWHRFGRYWRRFKGECPELWEGVAVRMDQLSNLSNGKEWSVSHWHSATTHPYFPEGKERRLLISETGDCMVPNALPSDSGMGVGFRLVFPFESGQLLWDAKDERDHLMKIGRVSFEPSASERRYGHSGAV